MGQRVDVLMPHFLLIRQHVLEQAKYRINNSHSQMLLETMVVRIVRSHHLHGSLLFRLLPS